MIRVLDPNPPHLGQSPKEENEISPKRTLALPKIIYSNQNLITLINK